jgi:hypothetical protein
MSASLNCARSAASPFLEGIMTQIPRIHKENVKNHAKRPEFRAFKDALARPQLRPPRYTIKQPNLVSEFL